MKKVLISLVLLTLVLGICRQEFLTTIQAKIIEKSHLLIIKVNNKYGLKDNKGKIIVKPLYDEIQESSYGLFVIIKNNKLGLIDNNGKILVRPRYDYGFLEYDFGFSDGLAAVIEKTKDGSINCLYVDKMGNEVLDPTKFGYSTVMDGAYGSCSKFSEGLAPVIVSNRDYGYITKTGKMVIKLKDVDVCGDTMCMSDFDKGFAKVEIKGKRIYINKKGKIIDKSEIINKPSWWTD